MTPEGWRRDAVPTLVCKCGHSMSAHDFTRKHVWPCSTSGCGCMKWRKHKRRWHEHRYVDEELPGSDDSD